MVPSLIKILEESGRQAVQTARGFAHGVIFGYSIPTSERHMVDNRIETTYTEYFSRDLGLMASCASIAISSGAVLLTNVMGYSLPSGIDVAAHGLFIGAIAGNTVSVAYESVRDSIMGWPKLQ